MPPQGVQALMSYVSSTNLGQIANRGLFTCSYTKSGLCKHQIGNLIPRFDYTIIVELTLL